MSYNRFAGASLERLGALSDGVFAIAMTLLALELRPPPITAIASEPALIAALGDLLPRLVTILMSFLTMGIFWTGQQTQLNHLVRADRDLAWIHIAFLAAVTLTPFTTNLLAEFIGYRTAILVYWLNILLMGALLFFSWRHAERAGLVRPDTAASLGPSIRRRILIAQALYAVGAALSLINTGLSIGFIFLVQLNYALAPKIPLLRDL